MIDALVPCRRHKPGLRQNVHGMPLTLQVGDVHLHRVDAIGPNCRKNVTLSRKELHVAKLLRPVGSQEDHTNRTSLKVGKAVEHAVRITSQTNASPKHMHGKFHYAVVSSAYSPSEPMSTEGSP